MTKAYTRARRRFLLDQDECVYNRGWAQWYNGYRTGIGNDTAEMRAVEVAWWAEYTRAMKTRNRALAHLIAVVRKEAK